MKKILKSEIIEIVIPNGSNATQFLVPDQPNLRDTKTLGIQAFYDNIVPQSILSQNAVVPKNVFQNSYITLLDYAGIQFCKQLPLVTLQTIENGLSGYISTTGETEIDHPPTIQEKDFKVFDGQIINWSKCFIAIPASISSLGSDVSFLLAIYYEELSPALKNSSKTTFAKKG